MRGLGNVFKGAVFIAGLAGAAAAYAAAGSVLTTVAPLSDQVTYSTLGDGTKKEPPFTGYIGYSLIVQNKSGNTINAVTWEGTIRVTTSGTEIIAFSSADGIDIDTCGFSSIAPLREGNSLTITCPIGQLKAGESRSFAMFFKAPIADLGQTSDNVDFRGRTITAEGFNGGNSANDSIDCWPYANALSCDALGNPLSGISVALGTASPTRIKSAVPKNGATFFTGKGVPTSFDQLAVITVVPPVTTLDSAEVIESEDPLFDTSFSLGTGCLNNFLKCTAAQLKIPGTFGAPYLITTVRIDASNIQKNTKIQNVMLWYTPDVGAGRVMIVQCPAPYTPWLVETDIPTSTSKGTPCWTSRTAYKPGYKDDPDLQGDFEWVFVNTKNGFLSFD